MDCSVLGGCLCHIVAQASTNLVKIFVALVLRLAFAWAGFTSLQLVQEVAYVVALTCNGFICCPVPALSPIEFRNKQLRYLRLGVC